MHRLTPLPALGTLLVAQLATAQPAPASPDANPTTEAQSNPSDAAPAQTVPTTEQTGANPAAAPAESGTTAPVAQQPGIQQQVVQQPTAASQPNTETRAPQSVGGSTAVAPENTAAPPPPMDNTVSDADAATPVTLMPSASMFSRYELRAGYADLGASRARFLEGDAVATRLRLGLRTSDIELGDGAIAAVQFTPQASGFWGQLPNTLSDASLDLHEAYLHYASGGFALDMGRLVLNYGDSLVIGSVDWHQTGRSFDGIRSRVSLPEAAWIDVFLTQLAEGRGGPDTDVGAGDGYFAGLYSDLGPLLAANLALEPYLLFNLNPAVSEPADPTDPASVGQERGSATQVTLGTRIKGDAGIADYRAEADLQFGKRPAFAGNPSVVAYQADAEVGVKVPDTAFRAALEGFIASGDDPSTEKAEGFDELYPTGHKWLGLMDVIPGRTNIAGGVLHLSYAGLKPLVLKSQAHLFVRPETPDGTSSYAGTELDLAAIYAIAAQLKLRVLYGIFLPGEEQFGNDSAAHYFETELRFDF